MSRSSYFSKLHRIMRVARFCDQNGLSTSEGIDFAAKMDRALRRRRLDRREVLKELGAGAAIGSLASLGWPARSALAARRPPNVDVGIVGAGISGLTCADTLQQAGVFPALYEARDRIGGRIWSMGRSFPGPVDFPGQVVERGGEFIDNLHLTLKGYAQEFGLELEDFTKEWLPGEDFWYVDDELVPEATIVDEFRDLVDSLRPDMAALSNEITPESFTEFDEEIDRTNLRDYLESRGASDLIASIIDISYTTEYGCAIDQQSALNFLFFIHIDKRSKFTPLGVFSDERFHVAEGNSTIPQAIAARLTGPIHLDRQLEAVRKLSDGRIELSFAGPGSPRTAVHDAVVLTLPFSVLREVDLDESLDLPDLKRHAIDTYLYGTNAKLHIGFDGRFWGDLGNTGNTYSNLRNHQIAWESNPIHATAEHAVLIDYSAAERGANLKPNRTEHEANLWLMDLDLIVPGAIDAVSLAPDGRVLAHLQHWPSDPFIKGSYTCNAPGYFTSIAGVEGMPVGNLYFAGEHTDSFYEWQGFMEGAANSGIRAADEILSDFR